MGTRGTHFITRFGVVAVFCAAGYSNANAASATSGSVPVRAHSVAAVGLDAIRVYEPPVRVRSQNSGQDVRKLRGAPSNLRQYLPTYIDRELAREKKLASGAIPASCFRRMLVFVERIDNTGWAVLSQQLNNEASCAFDAYQRVAIKATSRGRGHIAVRLGSGGMPDCSSIAAAGAPQGLVLGC